MRLLARREQSAGELLRKLVERGYPEDIARQVVTTLQDGGWQNDARYAEQLTRTRLRKGYGPLYIQHRLRQEGVEAPVGEILQEEGQDWDSLIAAVYRKKYGATAPGDANERAKRARFLQGRGFTVEQIRRFLDNLKQREQAD